MADDKNTDEQFTAAAVEAATGAAPAAAPRADGLISEEEERADEYKETWLKMWNNTTNPKEVSCRTAFDILAWCFGPMSQLRSMYRTGQATMCTEQRLDFQLCLKVKAAAMKDPEGARDMLRAARAAKEDPRPHIWKMRTEPPEQFRPLDEDASQNLKSGIVATSPVERRR